MVKVCVKMSYSFCVYAPPDSQFRTCSSGADSYHIVHHTKTDFTYLVRERGDLLFKVFMEALK